MENTEEYQHFFQVELDLFKGPIDLLLHLVKQNELEIEKVSLAQVADQYLACLDNMGEIDLEVAGEYLVIAATLLSVKSSILLNEPVELVEDEEGNLIDPHEELLQKLREAAVYKEGASMLGERDIYEIDVFSAKSQLRSFPTPDAPFKDHDPYLLGKAFHKILKKLEEGGQQTYNITLESVSIVQTMMHVLDKLKEANGPVEFHKLIPDLQSRGAIIGTFVALLELCKRQAISVRQDESFEDILIVPASEETTVDILSSEFDEAPEAQDGEGEEFNQQYVNGDTVNG